MKTLTSKTSPTRRDDGTPEEGCNPETMSLQIYEDHAKEASENLMKFLSNVLPEKKICVMYFDEAHELGVLFWILLRLVQHQVPSLSPEMEPLQIRMWYTLMGTKSSVSFYAPRPSQRQSITSFACTCLTAALVLSLRLRNERAHLLYPYIDLGFDQRVIAKSGQVTVLMGDMQTTQFLSQYGRPLYVDLTCKQQLFISYQVECNA